MPPAPRAFCALIALMAIALAPPAIATTALQLSDAEQARVSTAVVIATVGKAEPGVHERWGRPITLTTVRIEEVLVGHAPAELRIEQLRGELDGVSSMIPGDADLVEGERCVLFLRAEKDKWHLTALGQSKYRIEPSPDDSLLVRDLEIALVRRGDDGRLEPVVPTDDAQTLGTFRKKMRTLTTPRPAPRAVVR